MHVILVQLIANVIGKQKYENLFSLLLKYSTLTELHVLQLIGASPFYILPSKVHGQSFQFMFFCCIFYVNGC